MQTYLPDSVAGQAAGKRADAILRKCVHCGFCNVTCPTYQQTGNELEGPRGRIYLIKRALEEDDAGPALQQHLDSCLTCRACEVTCPAGVEYSQLLDIGRRVAEAGVPRPTWQRIKRRVLLAVLPYPRRFRALLGMARLVRPLLPGYLRSQLPERARQPTVQDVGAGSVGPGGEAGAGRVVLLRGCVQPALDGTIDDAAARVLRTLGFEVIELAPGCCGGLSLHLGAVDQAQGLMRATLDALAPHLEKVDAIVSTASGCAVSLKDYAVVMGDDPAHGEQARRTSELARDLSEVVAGVGDARLRRLRVGNGGRSLAYHPPCTLQHGQRLPGAVERLFERLGTPLALAPDSATCCGAAGSYSIMQPGMAEQLRQRKLGNLRTMAPDMIVTANIGCQLHLQGGSQVPVRHWVTLLEPAA